MRHLAAVTASREWVLRELAGPPLDALRGALGEANYERVEIHGRACGGTSTCYYLRRPFGERLVFKRPLPGEDLGHEFALLRRAAAAQLPIQMPRPVVELEAGHGYVMGRVAGERLREFLIHADAARIAETARSLLAALSAWHAVIGEPYGDFHAANALVRPDGGLAFIDPGESTDVTDASSGWKPADPMVVDLGLWMHNCALDAPAAWARRPREANVMRALAVELSAQAAQRETNGGTFVRRVFERAALHGGRLWRDAWPARRARAPLVRMALIELQRASLRRASRG